MTIRRVDVADATESLATYIREATGSGPVVVTEEGQPVAALVILEDMDLESVTVSTDPKFMALIQHSRARYEREGGLSTAEVKRRLEGEPTPRRRRR
jgi:antitoxin (DNA-binding transcriptional repressor) of toxin-antitoxin stability system